MTSLLNQRGYAETPPQLYANPFGSRGAIGVEMAKITLNYLEPSVPRRGMKLGINTRHEGVCVGVGR
jgi:hypothetical protein